jgi:hypothetical protein
MAVEVSVPEVERERSLFKRLVVENPNYFGNLADSPQKPTKKMLANTRYEELTCVGFNPQTNFLEATIAVKLPFGYGGDLCQAGTTEYVRFFVNYGSGWEDAGYTGVNVHDIVTDKDCAGVPNKPLTYVASLKYKPKTECCRHLVLPKVHAILSWQWIPPAGPINVGWLPPWGNALECNVQIKPHPWNILCLLEEVGDIVGKKIDVPPLFEPVKDKPIPLPDPPPFTLAELAKKYAAKPAAPVGGEVLSVEPHRFGLSELHTALSVGGFDQAAQAAKVAEWKAAGLDWVSALGALDNTKANVSYEELECLGIDDTLPERLVATFRIKRPGGYSGDLCHKGSSEYVAFWADWDNECKWTYLGTAQVNVHDIPEVSKTKGLCYSAILPVDLTYLRRSCEQPKIARIRAVLSWAVPPSTTDPDALNYWGNRLDAHVQINPGDVIDPHHPLAKIRNLGGIPIEDIDTIGNGMTKSTAVFAHFPYLMADQWNLGRACPFGGIIHVEGNYYLGYYYRVRARQVADPVNTLTTLANDFKVERLDSGFDHQVAPSGWFAYLDPLQEFDRTLAIWNSPDDALWDVQLEIATAPNDSSIIASSPWYHLQLDNLAPSTPSTMDIHIAAGGDCKDFDQSTTITGTFIADDLHFGAWSLSTEPNTISTPSNQPVPIPFLASTNPAPGPGGHGWSLDTNNPVSMKPCGYVVRLDVSDRTIVSSVPNVHNSNHIEVGFCLREKK